MGEQKLTEIWPAAGLCFFISFSTVRSSSSFLRNDPSFFPRFLALYPKRIKYVTLGVKVNGFVHILVFWLLLFLSLRVPFSTLPPPLFYQFSTLIFLCSNGANNAVGDSVFLGAWSCAFCTSEVLDVKYFFEPKFLSCVHVDFIVFLWIMSFETNKCSFQKKRFSIVSLMSPSVLWFREQRALALSFTEGLLLCCPLLLERRCFGQCFI